MTNGKTGELKKELAGSLIGLARASQGNGLEREAQIAMYRGLEVYAEGTDAEAVRRAIDKIHFEKRKLAPNCANCAKPCGRNDDYDMNKLYLNDEKIRSAKLKFLNTLMLFAPFAAEKAENGSISEKICSFFCCSLFAMGIEWEAGELESYFQSILKDAAAELIGLRS